MQRQWSPPARALGAARELVATLEAQVPEK
jgi:hypothetical protein